MFLRGKVKYNRERFPQESLSYNSDGVLFPLDPVLRISPMYEILKNSKCFLQMPRCTEEKIDIYLDLKAKSFSLDLFDEKSVNPNDAQPSHVCTVLE